MGHLKRETSLDRFLLLCVDAKGGKCGVKRWKRATNGKAIKSRSEKISEADRWSDETQGEYDLSVTLSVATIFVLNGLTVYYYKINVNIMLTLMCDKWQLNVEDAFKDKTLATFWMSAEIRILISFQAIICMKMDFLNLKKKVLKCELDIQKRFTSENKLHSARCWYVFVQHKQRRTSH